jgi:hypothetical protein
MITHVEQIIKILRPVISQNSGILLDDIINSDSIHGAELTKIVDGEKVPYSTTDNIIVFDFYETNGVDIIETDEDDVVHTVNSYAMHLVIYGDKARTVALTLKARLLSPTMIQRLARQGVSISSISQISSTTENINTAIYIRRDMTINFISHITISQVDVDYDVEELQEVNATNN